MTEQEKVRNDVRYGYYDSIFQELYGVKAIDSSRKRYLSALDEFAKFFGSVSDVTVFSAPGRTELGGNHTDHNHGKALAAAIDLDVIAVVAPRTDNVIRLKSAGFNQDTVNIGKLSPEPQEKGTSAALIRGVAAGFAKQGLLVGGFDAYTTNNVLKGSGLSSSAAFEVVIGTIFNFLYNNNKADPVSIAKAGMFAENQYFGKLSGMLDQLACAHGGIISIDLADFAAPVIERVPYEFSDCGYNLCVVDTGGDHTALTADYSCIASEMSAVSKAMGVSNLRATSRYDVMRSAAVLRKQLGDRALMRALHFFDENDRVDRMVTALIRNDFHQYLRVVQESGHSSFEMLQNNYSLSNPSSQGIPLALAISSEILKDGAWRVHGGGFAGTAQVYVPFEQIDDFTFKMENVFGPGCCHFLKIRRQGGIAVDELLKK